MAGGAARARRPSVDETPAARWQVTPGALRGPAPVDCGLAGTVMRFVPPMAALAAGRVALRRRRRTPGSGRWAGWSRPCARSAPPIDDGGRDALPFTVHGAGALPGGTVTIDASASSQFVSGAAARRRRGTSRASRSCHDGEPVPSLPHIDMTVAMLRAAGVEVDDSEPNTGGSRPGPIRALRRGDRAGPVQRRAVPRRRAGHRRARHRAAAGRRAPPSPATRCATCSPRWARTSPSTPDGLTVTAGDRLLRARRRPARRRRADPRARRPLRAGRARRPRCAASRTCAATRPTGSRRWPRELTALGGDVTETDDGLEIRPRPLHGGVLRHATTTTGWRRPARCSGSPSTGSQVENIATTAKTMPDFPAHVDAPCSGSRRLSRPPRLDEDDVRVRPGRASRPRTRTRPKHEDAVAGFVFAVDRGRFTCRVGLTATRVTAMRARELGRKAVVVGDRVGIVGDVTGGPTAWRASSGSSRARRCCAAPPTTTTRIERVVVANAEQLVIVTALADPPPRTGLHRPLPRRRATTPGLEPLLCLTKADLVAGTASLPDLLAPLRRPGARRRHLPARRAARRPARRLADRVSVLVGHSGVGKSTLVNALVPDAAPGDRRGQRDRQGPAHVDVRRGAASCPAAAG